MDKKLRDELNLLDAKFEKARKAILEQHNRLGPIENELLDNRNDYFQVLERVRIVEQEFRKLSIIEDVEKFLEDKAMKQLLKKAMGSINEEMIYNRIQVRYNDDIARIDEGLAKTMNGVVEFRKTQNVNNLKLIELDKKFTVIMSTLNSIIEKEKSKKTLAKFLKSCYTNFINMFS
jgi:hypothetical protein